MENKINFEEWKNKYKYGFECPLCSGELRYLRDVKVIENKIVHGKNLIVCGEKDCSFKEEYE